MIKEDLITELDKLTKKIYEMAGSEFNINSPKQLGEVLFVKMGLKNNKKRGARTGKRSTISKTRMGRTLVWLHQKCTMGAERMLYSVPLYRSP
jgi:hypothetical protein